MKDSRITALALELVDLLVREGPKGLLARGSGCASRSSDIRHAIAAYGKTLMLPPRSAYEDLDAVQVESADLPTFSVWIPLWTQEEGRSDLHLMVEVVLGPGQPVVTLEDVRVP